MNYYNNNTKIVHIVCSLLENHIRMKSGTFTSKYIKTIFTSHQNFYMQLVQVYLTHEGFQKISEIQIF